MKTIIVKLADQDNRLDKFLTLKLKISRSQVQKLITSGAVLLNDKIPTVHEFLTPGDLITVDQKKKPTPLIQETAKAAPTPKFKLLAEEPDYLIIEKPSGLLVHPTTRGEKNTLIDQLLKKYPALTKIGGDPGRPAIVHRLDREVSGLMIVPKTQAAFDYFKHLFQTRKIKKEYLALVHGVVSEDHAQIDFPIARSGSGLYVARPRRSTDGKKSLTEIDVIKRFVNFTYLLALPHTGRTNQIRVHLNAINHPIVGDALYAARLREEKSKIKLKRVFLHATKLSFTDLTGKKKVFESKLPKSLGLLLQLLKS